MQQWQLSKKGSFAGCGRYDLMQLDMVRCICSFMTAKHRPMDSRSMLYSCMNLQRFTIWKVLAMSWLVDAMAAGATLPLRLNVS